MTRTKMLLVSAVVSAAFVVAGCGKKKEKTDEPAKKEPAAKTVDKQPPPPPDKTAGVTEAVVTHHLDAFGKGDMEAILSDYADDAALISAMGTLQGKDQLQGLFTQLFEEFGQEGVKFQMGKMIVEGDVAMITWSADTPNNAYHFGTDTFVVKDGKIVAQTFAAKMEPKGDAKQKDEDKAEPPPHTGPNADVVNRHLEAFGKRDMDAILSDYADDAFLMSPMLPGTLKGHATLKTFFEALFEEFAKPGAKVEVDYLTTVGDVVFLVWHGESADNTYEMGIDTFVVREGKIVAQTFGAVVVPKAAKK